MTISASQVKELRERTGSLPAVPCGLTLSVGLASLHADQPASAEALVLLADRALYAAKAAGGNYVVPRAGCDAATGPWGQTPK